MAKIYCRHLRYWQRVAAKTPSVSLLQEHEEQLKYEYNSQIAYRKGRGKKEKREREREKCIFWCYDILDHFKTR